MRYQEYHKEAHAFEVEDTSRKLDPSEAKAKENDPYSRYEHQAESNVQMCCSDEIDIVICLSTVWFIEVKCRQSSIPLVIPTTEHSIDYINEDGKWFEDNDSFLEGLLHS